MSYKPDIDDVRESPSLDIIRLLNQQGADVVYHDPYVPEPPDGDLSLRPIAFTEEEIRKADCVVIATDHSCLDYEMLGANARQIVDTRNAMKRVRHK